MAFKEYGSMAGGVRWLTLGGFNKKTGQPNQTKVTGYYLGSTSEVNKFDATKEKVTLMVQTEDGEVGVNASSQLIKVMKQAEVEFNQEFGYPPRGAAIEIEFIKEIPTGKGNPAKIFTVRLDGDDMLEGDVRTNGLDTDEDEVYAITTPPTTKRPTAEDLLKRGASKKN